MAIPLLEGTTLGKYQILEPLGRGGMARVYRAYHPQMDRYVAIKVMRSDLTEDGDFLARFQREARAIGALRHTNIVQVYDFDMHDGIYFMVMELLEGDSLKTRLNDCRLLGERMPYGEIIRIMLDVLDGLAYAHSEGVIHRDIKPANVLLTKRGQAVLGDFGIAHIIGGTRYTMDGMLMGTLEYMAPEQGLKGQCDARSDLYSLGVVFYEMLVQRVPFEADTPLAILMKHVNDPLPLPRKIDSTIPKPLERIVLKALAKNPDSRFESAQAMADAVIKAGKRAGIEIPDQISLPLSFTTSEDPSASVAVISGDTRSRLITSDFAEGETDITLQTKLDAERAAVNLEGDVVSGIAAEVEEKHKPEIPVKSQPRRQRSKDRFRGSQDGSRGSQSRSRESKNKFLALKAIFGSLGIVAAGNLVAIFISGVFNNWSTYRIGWPMELFLVSASLFFIMALCKSIWLFIPAGILLANGILMAYSSLTGNWQQWAFLWVLEPWVIAATIVVSITLAKQPQNARRISRLLGWSLCVTSLTASTLTSGAAMAFGVIQRLLNL
jgi:serine/threonine protein kinase